MQRTLTAMHKLCQALATPKGALGRQVAPLREALQDWSSTAEIKLPDCVRAELMLREALQSIADGEFATFIEVLANGADACGKESMEAGSFSQSA